MFLDLGWLPSTLRNAITQTKTDVFRAIPCLAWLRYMRRPMIGATGKMKHQHAAVQRARILKLND